MSDVFERIKAAKARGDLTAIAEHIPYLRLLGIGFEETGEELRATMHFSEAVIGNPRVPALHGGAIGSLLESAAVFEVLWRVDLDALPKTINITVDYQRSAKLVDTYCTAVITKQGRRVINVQASAWQDDRNRPVAVAQVHLLVK